MLAVAESAPCGQLAGMAGTLLLFTSQRAESASQRCVAPSQRMSSHGHGHGQGRSRRPLGVQSLGWGSFLSLSEQAAAAEAALLYAS